MPAIANFSRLESVAAAGQQLWRVLEDPATPAPGADGLWLRRLPDPAVVRALCASLQARHRDSRGQAGLVAVAAAPERALALWQALAQPNLMLALPASAEGLAALEALSAAGANTLLYLATTPAQRAAARAAHRRGLGRRLEQGLPLHPIASLIAPPLAALDAAIDAELPPSGAALRGQCALACARLAVAELAEDSSFAVFRALGAAPQRLLWEAGAPYRDALILPDTVCALDAAGWAHWPPASASLPPLAAAQATLAQLRRHGIDLDTIGNQLLGPGLRQSELNLRPLLA
ncbi:transaldolase family protein [Massilia sp. TS11]|uniref:transaldolase family protein n=1 Tax=Massilia sp. TS11 TaxID=2908003 RepID=UPI001EDAAD79|nr:transaldolase family protein [Massilia sp. TS11]MCG2586084.1 hypothetical protein [Massilia sp. TS11]